MSSIDKFFIEEEIELLQEGLDLLDFEEKETNRAVNSFGSILTTISESKETKHYLAKKNQESRLKRERIVLLKAKLIKLQNKTFIDDLD